VSGVLQVIVGWLVTALVAFLISGLLVLIIYKTGAVGIFLLTILAAFLLIRSHIIFSQKLKTEKLNNQLLSSDPQSRKQAIDESKELTIKNLKLANKVYTACLEAIAVGKPGILTRAQNKNKDFWEQNSKLQNKIIKYVRKMPKADLQLSRMYILLFNHIQDLQQSIKLISESCLDHLDNHHSVPSDEYLAAAKEIEILLTTYVEGICEVISQPDKDRNEHFLSLQNTLSSKLSEALDLIIKDIQQKEVGYRIGRLQTKLLLETKDIKDTVSGIYNLYVDIER